MLNSIQIYVLKSRELGIFLLLLYKFTSLYKLRPVHTAWYILLHPIKELEDCGGQRRVKPTCSLPVSTLRLPHQYFLELSPVLSMY